MIGMPGFDGINKDQLYQIAQKDYDTLVEFLQLIKERKSAEIATVAVRGSEDALAILVEHQSVINFISQIIELPKLAKQEIEIREGGKG